MGTERPLDYAQWMRWVEKQLRMLDSRIVNVGPTGGVSAPAQFAARGPEPEGPSIPRSVPFALSADDEIPELLNGWCPYGSTYEPPAWTMVDGLVRLQGLIKDGSWGKAAFALPEGMRPEGRVLLPVIGQTGAVARLDITPDGVVVPRGGTGWVSLSGVSFVAASSLYPTEGTKP